MFTLQTHASPKDLGGDASGADGVDPDTELTQLNRSGARHLDDTRFGGAVGVGPEDGAHPRHTGGGDDAAAALDLHHPGRMFDAAEHAPQQYRHGGVVGVEIQLVDGTANPTEPGIVEHHIESTEPGDGQVHGCSNIGFATHIAAAEHHPVTQLCGHRRPTNIIEIGQHHLGSLRRKQPDRAGSDAAGTPGDDCNFTFESAL